MNFIKVYAFFSITTFLSVSLMAMEVQEEKKKERVVELSNNGVVRVVVNFNEPIKIRLAQSKNPCLQFDCGYIFKEYTVKKEIANGAVIEFRGHIDIEGNYVGCGDVIKNGEKVPEPLVLLFTENKVNEDGSALEFEQEGKKITFYPLVHTMVKEKSTRKFPF